MSKYVIMETVDGMSYPVALRATREEATACCVELANKWSQKAKGHVQQLEDGAKCSTPEVTYLTVEIVDTGAYPGH